MLRANLDFHFDPDLSLLLLIFYCTKLKPAPHLNTAFMSGTKLRSLGQIYRTAIRMTVNPSLPSSLQSLIHHRAFASLSLFCHCCFDFRSSELASSAPITLTFVHLPRSQTSSYPYRVSTQEYSTFLCQLPFFSGPSKVWSIFPTSFSHSLGSSQQSGSNMSVPRRHSLRYHLAIGFTSQIASRFICYNNLDFQLA